MLAFWTLGGSEDHGGTDPASSPGLGPRQAGRQNDGASLEGSAGPRILRDAEERSAPHHTAPFPRREVSMLSFRAVLTVGFVFAYAAIGVARADEPPAGATGRCKDGSYTESASKRGACKGHGGVAEWLATQSSGSAAKTEKKAKATTAEAAPSTPPEGATGKCKDGSYTTSGSKKGACRGHGGVAEWTGPAASSAPATPAASAPAPAPSKRTTKTEAAATTSAAPAAKTSSNTDPTGATAQCKDGTYSHSKHHTGACSHHGGVAQWLSQ